jgi:hypothetical protein
LAERKEFFQVDLDIDRLSEYSTSPDSSLRWAAAIELGQLGSQEAISILWSLTTDQDENVRDAANLSLQHCDQSLVGKVLAAKWSPVEAKPIGSDEEIQPYLVWKIRPLEIPSLANEWAVDAALLNIIQTESPMMGSRLLRLYGNAAYPDNPRKLPRSRIQTAIKRLERRKLVSWLSDESTSDLETWTLFSSHKPEVIVRDQGPRKLNEIPVTEVIARLQIAMREDFSYASQNQKFEVLMQLYGIKQADLHKLGDVLEKEWSLLLKV